MKKLILSGALLLALSSAHAQTKVGLKAGLSIASYGGGAASSSSSSTLGLHTGVVFNSTINDRFSVQPEVLYSQKGVHDEATVGGNKLTGTQTLHYIDVPVLAKLRFGSFFVEAGPQFSLLMAAKQEIKGGSSPVSSDNKAAFEDTEIGFALGVGAQSASGALFGVRYNGGFTNIVKAQSFYGTKVQPNITNRVIEVYVGVLFGK